jgi:hypothetical protein
MSKAVKIIALAVLCAFFFLLGACSISDASAEQTFPLKIYGCNRSGYLYTYVVEDEDTGVNYVLVEGRRPDSISVSITPRLNADGTLYTSG